MWSLSTTCVCNSWTTFHQSDYLRVSPYGSMKICFLVLRILSFFVTSMYVCGTRSSIHVLWKICFCKLLYVIIKVWLNKKEACSVCFAFDASHYLANESILTNLVIQLTIFFLWTHNIQLWDYRTAFNKSNKSCYVIIYIYIIMLCIFNTFNTGTKFC